MNVAYVIDSLGSGGAQRQTVEIASRLVQEPDVRVRVCVYRDFDFFKPRLEAAGIVAARLPKRGPLDLRFPRRLRTWLASEPTDVVHALLPLPTIWTALARRGWPGPAPVWIAAERSAPEQNTPGLLGWALRRAYHAYDAVTANSRPAAETLVSDFGLPRERVHYLPNGIDLVEWDRRAAEPAPIELEPGRFHLALVGRVSEEKNHLLLLAALGRLPPELRSRLCCWFVGADDGTTHIDTVRREVQEAGLADVVRMVPATPSLPALMTRLDALVLPSRFEGFPNVVMEAMASRLPVIASSVGDVPSLLRDGQGGFVVPPGDAAALAAALARMVELDADARAALGAAGRAAVEAGFRIEDVTRAHLELYRRLAHDLPGRAEAAIRDARPRRLG